MPLPRQHRRWVRGTKSNALFFVIRKLSLPASTFYRRRLAAHIPRSTDPSPPTQHCCHISRRRIGCHDRLLTVSGTESQPRRRRLSSPPDCNPATPTAQQPITAPFCSLSENLCKPVDRLRNTTHRFRNHGRSRRKPHHVEVHAVSSLNALDACTPRPDFESILFINIRIDHGQLHWHRCINSSRCFGDKGDVEDITEGTDTCLFFLHSPCLCCCFGDGVRHIC